MNKQFELKTYKSSTIKNLCIYTALAVVLLATACKKNETGSEAFSKHSTSAADYPQSSLPVVTVSSDINTNTTWASGNVYELKGIVTVKNGATLTIEPGTYIKAATDPSVGTYGILVIARDGKIHAVGTPTNPIVFTSRYLLDNSATPIARPSDFGGVIILGNAKVNAANKLIEGVPDQVKFHYGGSDNTDNRGEFQYVRIEFAGYQVGQNIGVNSLNLGGVGSGTTIDHVQASYASGDGFAFFGGTVSPTNLISLAANDDQFDFNNGYTGFIQYAIAVADRAATHSSSSGNSDSHGIELDNNFPAEDATFSSLPKTHPILVNFSIIGTENTSGITNPGYSKGIRIRRGGELELYNSIITGYPSGIVSDADANASLSTLTDVSAHGFNVSKSAAVGNFIDGGGNSFAVAPNTNASTYSTITGALPWYNSPGSPGTLNFATGTSNGGYPLGVPNWTAGWRKFVY